MKKKIKLAVKIIFIFAAVYIIFHKLNIKELEKVRLSNPVWLFGAFLFYNLSQAVSALRIQNYLKHIKVTPAFKTQLILYYLGMFYNTLLPGGIGGDAYKAYKFQKSYEVGYKKIIKALLIDRISGLYAIVFLLLILLPFSKIPVFNFSFSLYLFIFLLLISPFVFYFFHKIFFVEFQKSFFKNIILSFIIQAFQAFAFVSVLFALGVEKHISDFVILFFISSIISVIPLSVGGVGLRELTFLYGLEYLHTNPATGVVAAFLFFIVTLISSTIGIIFIKKEINV